MGGGVDGRREGEGNCGGEEGRVRRKGCGLRGLQLVVA